MILTPQDINAARQEYIAVIVADYIKKHGVVTVAQYNLVIEAANWSWRTQGKRIFLNSFN